MSVKSKTRLTIERMFFVMVFDVTTCLNENTNEVPYERKEGKKERKKKKSTQ